MDITTLVGHTLVVFTTPEGPILMELTTPELLTTLEEWRTIQVDLFTLEISFRLEVLTILVEPVLRTTRSALITERERTTVLARIT